MTDLARLHTDIDARVGTIREQHPEWPCSKGCDSCCRQLAALPQLTADEWMLLQAGLAKLRPEQLAAIRQRMSLLGDQPRRPVTCPLLDPDTGACPVYLQRPIACRTYGFYVQRDKGLYCHEIETRVREGTLAEVVWGNHDVI
ncbi:MAG: YkgJ family cysteine cluster protein, partial [Betaproteobacteria bacterium]